MSKAKVKENLSSEFPKMLYKHGGEHEIHGGKFDICTVENEDDENEALENGWFLTTPEASEAFNAAQAELAKQPEGGATVGNWGGAAKPVAKATAKK